MAYFYHRFASGKFTTMYFPRSYDDHETVFLKNIEWETGGIARGVERYHNDMT